MSWGKPEDRKALSSPGGLSKETQSLIDGAYTSGLYPLFRFSGDAGSTQYRVATPAAITSNYSEHGTLLRAQT